MNLRNKRGITLIALIVTIIVLIIIAGITVATLVGDNGVITRAENARNESIESGKLENSILGSYENLFDEKMNLHNGGNSNQTGGDNNEEEEENPDIHTHDYSILVSVTAPTCAQEGKEIKKCTGCEETQTTTIAKDPNNHIGETKEECVYVDDTQHSRNVACADCLAVLSSKTESHTNNGSGVCTECGQDITSGHAHNYTVFVETVTKATCVTQAQNKYACSVCGVTANRAEGDLAEHSWDEGVVTTEPTTAAEGVRTYTCLVCNGTKTEAIEKLQGTDLTTVASIGDLVNYDPTSGGNATSENTTYTSVAGSTTSHGNGYGSQTFSAANYKNAGGQWRILDIDDDGTITLISDLIYQDSGTGMGTTGLYISNGVGYIWAEEELNRIAAIYGHGAGADINQTITYYYGGPNDQDGSIEEGTVEAQQGRKATLDLDSGARALTVEDVNKICGQDSTYTANYSSSTVTKNSKNAQYYPTIRTTNTTTGESAAQSTFSGSYYITFYSYRISSANSDTEAKTNQNSMLIPEEVYRLASRYVNINSGHAYFCVRSVNSSGNVSGAYVGRSIIDNWSSGEASFCVRSVITLKSGIQTSDTEYDSTIGWNLAD